MKIKSADAPLFQATGAKRWLNRPRPQRGNAIFPLSYETDKRAMGRDHYLWADDPRALKLTERLCALANSEFKPDVLPSGFCGPTAVPGNFDALLNVSGIGMNPLPLPLTNNREFVKAMGVAQALAADDAPWLKELMRLFFGAARATDLHIRKAASFSFPFFATDNEYKKLAVLKSLREPGRFLELMGGDSRSLRTAQAEYHAMYLYAIHERQQPNAILRDKAGAPSSKPRTAPTEQEARSGSYKGATFADMTARREDGSIIDGHFAMRRRDVFGLNGVLNYFLSSFAGCFRAVYLERFAFTYKTRGAQDKADRIAPYRYVVGSDVKTMDKLIPSWFIDTMCDELHNYLDERVVKALHRAFRAPFVVPPPWAETSPDYDPVFGGSPYDPTAFVNHPGLPSGISWNPDVGKLWMTFVYLILMRDVGALSHPSQIEAFLQGRNPDHALLDMSDDAAFLTNSPRVAAALKKPKSRYAILEVETPVIYLGDVFTETGHGKDAFPNPVTFLTNLLCREDSIDRKGPVLWAQGYLARCQVYSRTPIFRDLLRMLEVECRSLAGVNPTLLARSLASHADLPEIDAMVRANPAVLHYKVDPATVSPAVLDEVVATLPHGDFFDYIKPFFKVPMA